MLSSMAKAAFYRSTGLNDSFFKPSVEKWLSLKGIRDFITKNHINVVVDVGANEGQFASNLRQIGFSGRIVSFEPDPNSYVKLRERHGKDPEWQGHCLALGDTQVIAPFNITKDSLTNSFLPLITTSNIQDVIEVQIYRLDSIIDTILAGIRSPSLLLKTDTQGFDINVLRGAKGCVDRIVGIVAELSVIPIYDNSPLFWESIREYQEVGFDIVDLFVVNRTEDGRILEFDGLFINRNKAEAPDADIVTTNWAHRNRKL